MTQLKSMIFKKAREVRGGDPMLIHDLQRISQVAVEMPLLKDHDEELQRTTCTGRFRIDLPTDASAAFGGVSELKADIEYAAQPAADASGTVFQVEGIGPLIIALATADLSQWRVATDESTDEEIATTPSDPGLVPAAPPTSYAGSSPSFDCTRASNFVEQAICDSPELSQKDNQLAARYREVQRAFGDEPAVVRAQFAWLKQRNACTDTRCIDEAYDRRLAELAF